MRRDGVQREERAWLMQLRHASRLPCVAGSYTPHKIFPTIGLPAGDLASSDVLGYILGSWLTLVNSIPGVRGWDFMDDLSITANQGAEQVAPTAKAAVDAALQLTQRFDAAADLVENASKRQSWSTGTGGVVENLGLLFRTVASTRPRPGVRMVQEKWDRALRMLRALPGDQDLRLKLHAAFVQPKVRW